MCVHRKVGGAGEGRVGRSRRNQTESQHLGSDDVKKKKEKRRKISVKAEPGIVCQMLHIPGLTGDVSEKPAQPWLSVFFLLTESESSATSSFVLVITYFNR